MDLNVLIVCITCFASVLAICDVVKYKSMLNAAETAIKKEVK